MSVADRLVLSIARERRCAAFYVAVDLASLVVPAVHDMTTAVAASAIPPAPLRSFLRSLSLCCCVGIVVPKSRCRSCDCVMMKSWDNSVGSRILPISFVLV
jgi:hypothetical protein